MPSIGDMLSPKFWQKPALRFAVNQQKETKDDYRSSCKITQRTSKKHP